MFDEKEMVKNKVNFVNLSNNIDNKNINNNKNPKLNTFDTFLTNIDFIIKYFKLHNELNLCYYENFENWISGEKYQKLFHQYELFYDELKQPLFRKRFLIQILILLNSFISPINQYQKSFFKFSQDQKENVLRTMRNCIDYLKERYNIYINDLFQNENIWSKWKENNCIDINKISNKSHENDKNKIDKYDDSKINEVKSLFKAYNNNYIINTNSNFINDINMFKETKITDIKFSDSIEGINSEVPFFGTYLEQIYKDLDPEDEEENTKERILNNMPSFSWKFLRLLSEADINKINNEEMYKLLSISEIYYKNFSPEDSKVKFNFKVLTPPPKIELKLKEEICLPKELLEKNDKNEYLNEIKDDNSNEEKNENKPVISLPKEILNTETIGNLSEDKNIKEIKITPKKEEAKELIKLPSILIMKEEKKNIKEEKEKVTNISNNNDNVNIVDETKNKEKDINIKIKPVKQEEDLKEKISNNIYKDINFLSINYINSI